MVCFVRRSVTLLILLLLACSNLESAHAAAHRTTNFIVTAPDVGLARQIAVAAESYRKSLAIDWLGHELPRWEQPIPVSAQVAPHLGAGGSTSFMFDRGRPFGWRMSIQGSRERLLDSVLPHEITHTIFATHFGRPLPRWADEGACTTVEHESEKAKQQKFLRNFMSSSPPRSIAFNRMFRMTEYPHDIMPLYAQGHSVAKFLLQQGGKRKFVDYVGSGMSDENWDRATKEFYGYRDLSDLQVKWVAWVAGGSRDLSPGELYVSSDRPSAVASVNHNEQKGGQLERNSVGRPFDSWYARQRNVATAKVAGAPRLNSGARAMARPQGTQQPRQMILDWDGESDWGKLPTSVAGRPSSQLRRKVESKKEPVYFDAPLRSPGTVLR